MKKKSHSNEEQYKILFEKNPYPMWIYDKRSLRFLAVNKKAISHYGYTRRKFLSMTTLDIRPEEEKQRAITFIQSLNERKIGEVGMAGIWSHIKENGERIYAETSYSEVTFNNRPAVVVLANDITEKKLAEEAAVVLSRKIAHILNSITDAFISFDPDWHVTYINRRAEELFQVHHASLIGKNIWRVFPSELSKKLRPHMELAIANMEVVTIDTRLNDAKWLRVHMYPSSSGLSIYMNDITIEKEIAQRKDEFISIASHELKTPLTSIKAYAHLLSQHMEQFGDIKTKKYFSNMNEQIERLSELLHNLLDVGRIQTGKMPLKKETFDLNEVIQKTIKEVKYIAKKHKVRIKGKIRRKVTGDKNRLADVLMNLLTNAIKYSPATGEIQISIEESKDKITVHVKDFGVGIASEFQDKIFARFYRVHTGTARETSGLGLGLYISKKIIEQHNGELWVKSDVGKGSTFSFSIPIVTNIK